MEDANRLESEILELKKNTLNIIISETKQKKDYYINITLPSSEIDPEIYDGDINFVLYIQKERFPLYPPRLYCTTIFCFPHFSDGRDILEAVLKEKWNSQMSLTSLLPLIPKFIQEFFQHGEMVFVGNYYLGERYNLKLLESSNYSIFFK